MHVFVRCRELSSMGRWREILGKEREARDSTTYQLHERTDRWSLFLFIPTIQFDRESLSKFGDIWGTYHFSPSNAEALAS